MEDSFDSEKELYEIIQVFLFLKMRTGLFFIPLFQDLAVLSENLKKGGGLSGDSMQLIKQTIRPARHTSSYSAFFN